MGTRLVSCVGVDAARTSGHLCRETVASISTVRYVSVSSARSEFSSLLAAAESGEEFVITRRGTPVARLVGLPRRSLRPVAEVIEDIREARKGQTLGGLTIKDLINEGRKY